ncbi:hypothetical protein HMPREF3293_00963 [Christensenella minuta]|uniref:Uncharacterized protein n=1 Tax=Christensenella minuta TaxID=626937 RepID=A0A136Q6N9_9FIRM|nr:hypothetical protein HMPREF3293_00963 [Christensenella minuta]
MHGNPYPLRLQSTAFHKIKINGFFMLYSFPCGYIVLTRRQR